MRGVPSCPVADFAPDGAKHRAYMAPVASDAAAAQDDPNKPFAEVVLKDCIIGQTTVKECCFAIQSAGNTALFQAKVRLAPRIARRADRTPRRGRARSRPDRCVVASH